MCWWSGLLGSMVERRDGLGAAGGPPWVLVVRELRTRAGGHGGSRVQSGKAWRRERAGAQRRRADRTRGDKQGRGSVLVSNIPFRGGLFFGRWFCGGCLLFGDIDDWIFSIFGVFSLIWLHFLLILVDYTSFAKIIEIWRLKMNFSKTFGDMGKSL